MKVKAMGIAEVAYTGRKSMGEAQRLGNPRTGVHKWNVERV